MALKKARLATSAYFLICGLTMASWAPMVPFAKDRLALSDGTLGLILLGLGAGAMLTMPLSGILINALGSRITMAVGAFLMCLSLPLLAIAPSAILLAASLFLFGAGCGALDVAMNAQAVIVEQKYGRAIMSSFHGLFSLGGLSGSLVIGLLLRQGLTLGQSALTVAGAALLLALWQFRRLLPRSEDHPMTGSILALPRGPVILIGSLCFIAFLAEGALLDWSAVFLRFARHFADSDVGLGYAIFSLAMTVGRLTGDRVSEFLGPVRTVRSGALLGAIGYLVVLFVPHSSLSLTGFALIGLGLANIVPLLFSAAGRLQNIPPSIAIAAVTTMGYAGLLAGPAIIGFVGNATTLALGLTCVAAALLFVAANARAARK